MRYSCIQCTELCLGCLSHLTMTLTCLTDRLHAEDLAFLLGMQQKDLRKLCAKLREDRLIGMYARLRHCLA